MLPGQRLSSRANMAVLMDVQIISRLVSGMQKALMRLRPGPEMVLVLTELLKGRYHVFSTVTMFPPVVIKMFYI